MARTIWRILFKRLGLAIASASVVAAIGLAIGDTAVLNQCLKYKSVGPLKYWMAQFSGATDEFPSVELRESSNMARFVTGARPDYESLLTLVFDDTGNVVEERHKFDPGSGRVGTGWATVDVTIRGFHRRIGLWAPTSIEASCTAFMTTPDTLNDLQRRLLIENVRAIAMNGTVDPAVSAAWGHAIHTDRAVQRIPILSGYFINTISFALVSILLYTLASTPFALRKALRASAHACPHCAYDLAGVDADLCPECGSAHRTVRPDVA